LLVYFYSNLYQWPRGLRRGSAAAWILGLRVWIPPGACLSLVSFVCCEIEVSASSWSLVKRSPTECGVSECDREASIIRRPWPTGGCCGMGGKQLHNTLERWKNLFWLSLNVLGITDVRQSGIHTPATETPLLHPTAFEFHLVMDMLKNVHY